MPKKSLKFGLFLPSSVAINRPLNFDSVMNLANKAEEEGYDSLWISHGVLRKTSSAGSVKVSCIPTMAALAARSSKVRIASNVLMAAQFNPITLALDMATIDHISHGRAVLGVGVGSVSPLIEREYSILGIPYRQRGERLNEVIEIIKKLWSEDKSTYTGRYFQYDKVSCEPKPFQRKTVPIFAAGKVQATFQRVAALCDGWIEHPVNRTAQDMAEANGIIDKLALKAGRSPKSIERAKHFHINLDHDRERAYRKGVKAALVYLGKNYTVTPGSENQLGFFGTPREFMNELEEFLAAGMQTAIIDLTIATPDPWRLFRIMTDEVVRCF